MKQQTSPLDQCWKAMQHWKLTFNKGIENFKILSKLLVICQFKPYFTPVAHFFFVKVGLYYFKTFEN